jgi:signal peptidase
MPGPPPTTRPEGVADVRIVKWVSLGLVTLLLCGIAATGITYWHDGYRIYVVHTGSMVPTLNPGDIVIDKPATHLVAGQIITFKHSDFTNDVVTHRIKWFRHGVIRTKGDANKTADAWYIRPDQVVGTVTRVVPKLGYLIVFLKQPAGIASVMTGVIALFLLWDLFFSDGRRQEAVVNAVRRRGAHRAPPTSKGRHALAPLRVEASASSP